jgi:hypothetical protein
MCKRREERLRADRPRSELLAKPETSQKLQLITRYDYHNENSTLVREISIDRNKKASRSRREPGASHHPDPCGIVIVMDLPAAF